jgi:hypothetical protein
MLQIFSEYGGSKAHIPFWRFWKEEKLFLVQVIGNQSSGVQPVVQLISLISRMKITLSCFSS